MNNPLVTLDPTRKCPTYTLNDIEAREPDFDEWELRNDMIERVVVVSCDHGFLSLGIDYVSGKQGVGYGHRNEANIGLMICALADLLETRYRNGDALAGMTNTPIRVLFRADPGGSVVKSTYIGHFMKDKFIKMSEWVKCGIS